MEKEIQELKEILIQMDNLRVRKLVSTVEKPDRLFGRNCALYLLRLHERSRDLLEDCVAAYEKRRALSLYILVRAHFETTASLMYLFGKMTKFYDGQINSAEMDEAFDRLSIGAKLKPDSPPRLIPDAVSVLTTIKHTDKLLKEMGSTVNMFTGAYDFISEIAHPNHLGLLYRSKVNLEENSVTFLKDEEISDSHFKSAVLKLLISANIFVNWYSESFAMLEKNETMPTFDKM